MNLSRKLALAVALSFALPLAARADAEQDAIVKDLLAGNKLYAQGVASGLPDIGPARRTALASAQNPKAIVLGCADSRVPPEHVFRQGLGDVFVTRIAGNVPMSGMVASIEYAVEHLGTKVLLVMGHQSCGAVKAAVAEYDAAAAGTHTALTPDLFHLVDEILPAVDWAVKTHQRDVLDASVHMNARMAAQTLLDRSEVVRTAWKQGELKIVVGYYNLGTGVVTLERDVELR
ncbi:MAG: carbonic anhydrase [Anaeromyxobacteraceae bacterium]